MDEALETRPARAEHYDLAMDAFLFAGAGWLALTLILEGLGQAMTGGTPPEWVQALNIPTMILPVVAGIWAAWWAHGRTVDGWSALGAVGGVAVGVPVATGTLIGTSQLINRLRIPTAGLPEGPWVLIGVLALVAVALIAPSLTRGITDLASGRSRHRGLDIARLVTVATVLLLALGVAPAMAAAYDSEIAEAGIFMLIFAATGAIGVLGADLVWTRRRRPHDATGSHAIPA